MALRSKMESWGGVDGDGRVGLLTEASVTGRPPRESERARGREGESGRRKMTGGVALSVREKGEAAARARARIGPPAGPRCWPSTSAGERAGTRAIWLGRTGGKEGSSPVRILFLFFLFQINK
jgi:hypothetical protein